MFSEVAKLDLKKKSASKKVEEEEEDEEEDEEDDEEEDDEEVEETHKKTPAAARYSSSINIHLSLGSAVALTQDQEAAGSASPASLHCCP